MEELDSSGIDYEKINLSLYPKRWDEVTIHTDGQKISPVMINGDDVTIGYNGLGCVYEVFKLANPSTINYPYFSARPCGVVGSTHCPVKAEIAGSSPVRVATH